MYKFWYIFLVALLTVLPRSGICFDSESRQKLVCAGFLKQASVGLKKNKYNSTSKKFEELFKEFLIELVPIYDEIGKEKFVEIMDEGINRCKEIVKKKDDIVLDLVHEYKQCSTLLKSE